MGRGGLLDQGKVSNVLKSLLLALVPLTSPAVAILRHQRLPSLFCIPPPKEERESKEAVETFGLRDQKLLFPGGKMLMDNDIASLI